MTTWGDIKLKALQKMFATNNGSTTIPTDNSTREYISAMPGAANEALQMLATVGKFIIKSVDIAHIPLKNLLADGEKIKSVERGSIEYVSSGARALYCEVKGKGQLTITVGEDTFYDDAFDSSTISYGFSPLKMLIENPDDLEVRVLFTSDYPLSTKNVALYSANFETDESIAPYSEYIRYYLPDYAPDYYMVDLEHVIYEGDSDISRYKATSDFFQEGFKVLLLNRDTPGNFKIYYKAYPPEITNATPDDEVLSLDPEVAALLPLYMASELYKDDDSGIATLYRNEFEIAFERLNQSVSAPSSEKFTSESGWI